LAKVACGAFADIGFVAGRQRRDFGGLRPEDGWNPLVARIF
jgi:hypothetical protein